MSTQRARRRRTPSVGEHERQGEAPAMQVGPHASARPARNAGGYLPGAIVRIACENFVTYDAVEFFPGPYLNMIIGPNGTGKSTVVCAIALGLGWKPSVLGRAKDVASYVKLGHAQGWVEVELQGFPEEQNVILRRIMFRDSNTSDWMLNGVAATVRDVHAAVSRFHVEVGNLCSFLPQDRVADFAAMTPSKLLQDTQHAAGDPHLSEWHAQLIQYGHQRAALVTRLEQEQKEHDHLEARNAVLERDIRRYEERVELEKRVASLQVRVAFANYREAKDRYTAAREKREEAKHALQTILLAMQPLETALEQAQQRSSKITILQTEHRREADEAMVHLKRLSTSRESIEQELASLHEQERKLESLEQERRRAMDEMRTQIAALEASVATGPPSVDLTALDQQWRAVKTEHRVATEDVRDLDAQTREWNAKVQRARTQHKEARLTLDRLQTVRYQRLQILARGDRDTYEATMWLEKNQGIFERTVYEPVLVALSLKHPEAARAIETCLSWAVQRTFVCQTRADYDLFTRELIDKRKWRLNVVEMEGGPALSTYTPPMPVSTLTSHGFDAYALDCIDAPPDVLRYLCSTAHLHAIPIAFQGGVDPAAMEKDRSVRRYISGDTIFSTTYSSYGQRLPQTLSRVLKPLRNFAHTSDPEAREHALHAVQSSEAELERAEAALRDLEADRLSKTTHLEQLTEQRATLSAQHQAAADEHKAWERLQWQLRTKKERLQEEEKRPSVALQRQQLDQERRKLVVERSKVAERAVRLLQTMARAYNASDEDGLALLCLISEIQTREAALRDHKVQVDEGEQAVRDAIAAFTDTKEHALTCKRRAERCLADASEDIQDQLREYVNETDRSSAELMAELERTQAQLEIPSSVGPSVMEAYRTRKEKIAQLQRTIVDARAEQVRLDRAIAEVEGHWLPALDALLCSVNNRFAAAFARMGCAGEVRLAREEDYEKWGIDILVKFRDTERLQLLTGQRQSGGERSLSTILYLLSLTELSRSPFSLVDEINQGMDPRAERAVHNHMVDITCRPEAGQYFLITPKLLPGLSYHPLMKVLIINNGEWLPEKLRLSDVAQRKRQRLALAAHA